MNWHLFTLIIMCILICAMYYFLRQKCPNCRKRGGICVYNKRENNGSGKKVYDVLYCGRCGYVISEVLIGETKEI